MKTIITLAFAALLLGFTPVHAQEVITPQKGEVVMNINGIVCPACAQGIIRKVSKLDFIDTERLHSGVDLDVENHRARIAMKQGVKPDYPALFAAVRKGGFDPVGVYLAGGKYLTADQITAGKE